MNKFLYPFLVSFLILCVSCLDRSFLDETVTSDLDLEKVFADSAFTMGFLGDSYRRTAFDVLPNRFNNDWDLRGGLQTASTEAKFIVKPGGATTDIQWVTGTLNPVIVDNARLQNSPLVICYEAIRRMNIFLQNVDRGPLSPNERNKVKAEARFLRAWYYYLLLKHYGGVPIVYDKIYDWTEEIPYKRASFAEVVDYILDEVNAAIPHLTLRQSGFFTGRVDQIACYGLITKVKLMAASPLFNGVNWTPPNFDKELVGYPTYNHERWKEVMDAAKKLMDISSCDLFDPDDVAEPFYQVQFYEDFRQNGTFDELIFGNFRNRTNTYGAHFQPTDHGSNAGGHPYQEFVDLFPMKNGKKPILGYNSDGSPVINPETPYDDQDPYGYNGNYFNSLDSGRPDNPKRRDPRLEITIVYDRMYLWQYLSGPGSPVNIYRKEKYNSDTDKITVEKTSSESVKEKDGTQTGYYVNKMVYRRVSGNGLTASSAIWPLIRYAEILLIYAEAITEYEQKATEEAYDILKRIRKRARILPGDDGMYGLERDMNFDQMRAAVRLERQLELAFEGHWFYDVRRWQIAEETENRQMHGMEPVEQLNGVVKYTRFPVFKHTFRPGYYLWPFPYREIAKSNDLVQNPYYE